MPKAPQNSAAAQAGTVQKKSANAAQAAFASFQPQIQKLHRQAERVANDRQKLIASITDPSLRASVR
jgi:hypothetical protein